MAWRFKASKYKNASFKFPKKEGTISELPVGSLVQSSGNHIKASCNYIVFNTDLGSGGSLGCLPINSTGKQSKNIPLIHAHSDFVSDFDFSPFDDCLLATGSLDNTVKIWLLPEEWENSSDVTSPEVTLPAQDRKIENVLWHTTADGILAASTHKTVKIFDVKEAREVYSVGSHDDLVQSISWNGDGRYLVTSCKDTKLRIIDPRTNTTAQEGTGCPNPKESRVLWLGNREQILTTGFDKRRQRLVQLHDARNLTSVLDTKNYDVSTTVQMPLYDNDTGMLFLAGKGDGSINYLEVNQNDPYLVENNTERTEQIKGMCMIPKRGVDVMLGEVTRLMILIQNSIIPTPVIIPRKTYRDFHEDLFPDTNTGEPSLSAKQWIQGENQPLAQMSLDPYKRPKAVNRRGGVFSNTPVTKCTSNNENSNNISEKPVSNGLSCSSKESTPDKPIISTKPEISSNKPFIDQQDKQTTNQQQENSKNSSTQPREKPEIPKKSVKPFAGVRKTKYRHLKACILHRSEHIENIRYQDRTVPGESDFFHANSQRCVVPIEGGGGLLFVLELSQKGKLPNTGVPYLQHGSKITDYVFDPFDDSRLVVCCDDGKARVWRIPEGGITDNMDTPELYLRETCTAFVAKTTKGIKNPIIPSYLDCCHLENKAISGL